MSRVSINTDINFIYSTEFPIMISHINAGNHLANENLLIYLNEARNHFYDHIGYDYRATGLFFVVADLAVVYQTEGKYGDVLKIEIGTADIHKKGCDLIYKVTEKNSGRPIAIAKTAHILFDPQSQSSTELPDDLRDKLKAG